MCMKSRKANNAPIYEAIIKDNSGRYGNLSQMLMELIDNSASNFQAYFNPNGCVDIKITRISQTELHVVVRDNGTGMMDIDKALTLGDKSAAETASNDHAQGFKNLNVKNMVLRTANINGKCYLVKGPFIEGVEIEEHEFFEDLAQGTEFAFDVDFSMLIASNRRWGEKRGKANISTFSALVECIAEDIGVVHGYRMVEIGYNINIVADDMTTGSSTVIKVAPVLPVIMPFAVTDPALGGIGKAQGRKTIPAFNGEGTIDIEYVIGMVDPRPSKKGYFQKNINGQGWHIYINNRYIGKTDALDNRVAHPSRNGCMGRVNFITDKAAKAPQTEIAKTGFVESSADYNRLMEELNALLPNASEVIKRHTKPAVSENQITALYAKKRNAEGVIVETQGQVPNTDDHYDILDFTNGILMEFKNKAASTDNVFQLVRYISAYCCEQESSIPFKRAYLVAKDCPPDAEKAIEHANFILERCGVQIEYHNLYEIAGDVMKELTSKKQK